MENKLKTLYSELNERLSFLQGLELSDDVIAQRAEVTLCIVRVQQLLLEDLPSDSAITSESREADGGKLPIDSESGKEVSWQETAINFMEESGRLKAENEKLRELDVLYGHLRRLHEQEYQDGPPFEFTDAEYISFQQQIRALRSELGLDK
jgi:hypothetical protein